MLFGSIVFCRMSQKRETFFRKTQMGVLGTSAQTGAPNGAFLAPNGAFLAPNGAFLAISPLGDFSGR